MSIDSSMSKLFHDTIDGLGAYTRLMETRIRSFLALVVERLCQNQSFL